MPNSAVWAGVPAIRGSSEYTRMFLLTFCLVGIQFTWGIEMTYCTPYLLELGLTKSKTSLVWIAGPLSGLITAPLVGAMADRSMSRYGRRRPYMIIGSFVVAVSLLVLGWATELVDFFLGDSPFKARATIFTAVLSIYAVDFSINVVMWSCRGLMVDTLPLSKQQQCAAWGSRMNSAGHLVTYGIGALDLQAILGNTLGDTQFKQLTVIAGAALIACVSVTAWSVTERILISHGDHARSLSPFVLIKDILNTVKTMPARINGICWIQFWFWIGWFPFVFYGPTWVGETYFRYEAPTRRSRDRLGEIGRIGSTALMIFSFVSFVGSIILPLVVTSPEDDQKHFTPRPPPSLAPIFERFEKRRPSLLTAWQLSIVIFAGAMMLTPFITTLRAATALLSVCGITATLATWAPFTFMGVEINRLTQANAEKGGSHRRQSMGDMDLENSTAHGDNPAANDSVAGVYLGILNVFSTLPQFIGTFISMIVFAIFEPGRSSESLEGRPPEGLNGIAVCLVIGAFSALGAAYTCSWFRKLPP